MRILVLGGTRYFGSHLIRALLKEGHEVHVATRGQTEFNFKEQIIFHKADRNVLEDLQTVAKQGPFDLIYDQVCMSAKAAQIACIAFNGKCNRYIFTSTGSVYNPANDLDLFESEFDPENYKINLEDTNPYDYQEAKRQAEAIFSQSAPFEVAMVRFPIVLGEDDYTGRLKFHVDSVIQQTPIYFPRLQSKMGFIQSHEAGEFLKYIGRHKFTGAVNAVSTGYISLKEMMAMIESLTGKKAVYADHATDLNHSPFGFESDFMMPNKNAMSLGFQFSELKVYLPELIKFFAS